MFPFPEQRHPVEVDSLPVVGARVEMDPLEGNRRLREPSRGHQRDLEANRHPTLRQRQRPLLAGERAADCPNLLASHGAGVPHPLTADAQLGPRIGQDELPPHRLAHEPRHHLHLGERGVVIDRRAAPPLLLRAPEQIVGSMGVAHIPWMQQPPLHQKVEQMGPRRKVARQGILIVSERLLHPRRDPVDPSLQPGYAPQFHPDPIARIRPLERLELGSRRIDPKWSFDTPPRQRLRIAAIRCSPLGRPIPRRT